MAVDSLQGIAFDGLDAGVEASVSDKLVSEEELSALLVDENLTDFERTKMLLSRGAPVQQLSALSSLHQLVWGESEGRERTVLLDELLPLVLPIVSAEMDPALLAAASESFRKLAESLPPQLSSMYVLPPVLAMLSTSVLGSVAPRTAVDSARPVLEVVRILLSVVPEDEVIKVVQLALARADVSQPAMHRLLASRLMGVLAESGRLKPSEVENKFFSEALSLCQDTDYDVRVGMCRQLNALSRAVSPAQVRERLVPELLELLCDEETEVAHAAFEALVQLIEHLPREVMRDTVRPLLFEYCAQPPQGMLLPLAQLFGAFFYTMTIAGAFALLDSMADGDVSSSASSSPAASSEPLLEFYCGLALRKGCCDHDDEDDASEVRRRCAYNFPAVLKSVGGANYARLLDKTYQVLCADKSEAVRVCVAAGMHQVAKLLGRQRSVRYIASPCESLMRDESRAVRKAMFSELPSLLELFDVADPELRASTYASLLPAIVSYGAPEMLGQEWRTQVTYFQHYPCFVRYFDGEALHTTCTPVLLRAMHEGSAPTRLAAAKSLCWFVRYNSFSSSRLCFVSRLQREFGCARSYPLRMLYADMCEEMLALFSRDFFKTNFMTTILRLAEDSVSAVRRRVCLILPALKRSLKFPADARLLTRIAGLYEDQMLKDENLDVVEAARYVQPKMEELERSIALSGTEEDNEDKERFKAELVLKEADDKQHAMLKRRQIENRLNTHRVGPAATGASVSPTNSDGRSASSSWRARQPTGDRFRIETSPLASGRAKRGGTGGKAANRRDDQHATKSSPKRRGDSEWRFDRASTLECGHGRRINDARGTQIDRSVVSKSSLPRAARSQLPMINLADAKGDNDKIVRKCDNQIKTESSLLPAAPKKVKHKGSASPRTGRKGRF